ARWGGAATQAAGILRGLESADEHERLGELAADGGAVEAGVGLERLLGARMGVLPPLRLVAGERGELARDRLRHVDEPVRDEPVLPGRRPLGARRGRISED